jgi:hypothetical protein
MLKTRSGCSKNFARPAYLMRLSNPSISAYAKIITDVNHRVDLEDLQRPRTKEATRSRRLAVFPCPFGFRLAGYLPSEGRL